MPLQNKKMTRFSNLSAALGKIALEGSRSDDAKDVTTHIAMMNSKLGSLRKKKEETS